jgi:hypothetical protein
MWRVLNMFLSPATSNLQMKIDEVVRIISQFNGAVIALSAGEWTARWSLLLHARRLGIVLSQ